MYVPSGWYKYYQTDHWTSQDFFVFQFIDTFKKNLLLIPIVSSFSSYTYSCRVYDNKI